MEKIYLKEDKISDLIEVLQEAKNKYGNVPVKIAIKSYAHHKPFQLIGFKEWYGTDGIDSHFSEAMENESVSWVTISSIKDEL
jgi:hypothetical protein